MNVRIQRNRSYYNSSDSEPCDCLVCKNYYFLIENHFPNICRYLEEFGVDVLRPLEISTLNDGEQERIQSYFSQYVVFGNCEDNFQHKIGEVPFSVGKSYPTTGISSDEDYFVLDFSLSLPVELL